MVTAILMASCARLDSLEEQTVSLGNRISALESSVETINDNSMALAALYQEQTVIVGKTSKYNSSGEVCGYILEISDGSQVEVTFGDVADIVVPVLAIDGDGNWVVSFDSETFAPVEGAAPAGARDGVTPQVKLDDEGYWVISYDGQQWTRMVNDAGVIVNAFEASASSAAGSSVFKDITEENGEMLFSLATGEILKVPVLADFHFTPLGFEPLEQMTLGEVKVYEVEMNMVDDLFLTVPDGWHASFEDGILTVTGPSEGTAGEYDVKVTVMTADGLIRNVSMTYTLNPVLLGSLGCTEWQEFVTDAETNVLLDFSYAGYDHGETAPPETEQLGYKVYNVCDYGAVPDDGKSDRQALLDTYQAIVGAGYTSKEQADAIIYFPEGEYILHTADDNNADGYTDAITFRAGNIVMKGAGRGKTVLVMADPSVPQYPELLYNSNAMIRFIHYDDWNTKLTDVTADAPKGTFSVEVASAAGLAAGQWVCLQLVNNSAECVAEEVAPYDPYPEWTGLVNDGVQVNDVHQIRSVSGNTVTFHEPIMHEVKAGYGWTVNKYNCYGNVGVEDLTFKGFAEEGFQHNTTWMWDGGYKPLVFQRIVNGWVRRVDFEDVSEGFSCTYSANCSVYDVEFRGTRGHATARSMGSSRIFIGATRDLCEDGLGQWHGVGVSRTAVGTVLWRNHIGSDSCIETHAAQPRATLVDCCEGGWTKFRMGGAVNDQPNHLDDYTVWNYNATSFDGQASGTLDWEWWTEGTASQMKFLPPTVVGFRTSGWTINFREDQMKRYSSPGEEVWPQSLYEAQLQRRLGYVPAWLTSLKAITE